MAYAPMLVILMIVLAAEAASDDNVTTTTTITSRPESCPRFLLLIACLVESSSCVSSEDCDEGDNCCRGPCGYDCYNEEKGFYRPRSCPKLLPMIACLVESSSCVSSADCDEGDDCCKNTCGNDCYNEKKGFYRPRRKVCPVVPLVYCFRHDEQCNDEKPCDEGQVCCPSMCGTACFSPDSD